MAIQAQLCADNFGFSLGGSPDWMEGAYGLNASCFNLHQKQNLQQKTQNPSFQNSGLVSNQKNDQDLAFSLQIMAQFEKQSQEVDGFICLQNGRLRLALQEQIKRQMLLLLRNCEAKAEFLLKQKDEEISKAMNKTGELEDYSRRLEIENQNWQRLVNENEAMVSYLNNKIEQLKENACCTNWAEDAESCCDEVDRGGERRDETGGNEENEEQITRKMLCKGCNSRKSCVVFLPCRHLCSCESCQVFLNSCPVCGVVKKATVEALI